MNELITRCSNIILIILGITLILLSLASIIYVTVDGLTTYRTDWTQIENFETFLGLFTPFKELYSATFVVLATYYALNQYVANMGANRTLIRQLEVQISDLNSRVTSEGITFTMDQCKYFLNEIQHSIRKLYRELDGNLDIQEVEWKINDFTEEDLHMQNEGWNEDFDQIEQELRDNVILTLSKLETFSIYFIHGNAHIDLGFEAIGKDYCKQVEYLYPLVSIWRSRSRQEKDNFYNGIVELYGTWKEELKKRKE
jgi:hypothetical protein